LEEDCDRVNGGKSLSEHEAMAFVIICSVHEY
jgi:hypothetical protein